MSCRFQLFKSYSIYTYIILYSNQIEINFNISSSSVAIKFKSRASQVESNFQKQYPSPPPVSFPPIHFAINTKALSDSMPGVPKVCWALASPILVVENPRVVEIHQRGQDGAPKITKLEYTWLSYGLW
jgi:hypothetical protein